MNKNARALMLIAGMTMSAAAMADVTPGVYLGGGYTDATLDLDAVDKDADIGMLFVRGGYQINQNVAVEARLGTTIDDDTIYGVDVEVEDMYGVYLKAGLPTQSGFYPYVLLGMTHVKVEASGRGGSASDSDSDISYGLGVDYWFNSQVSAGLEFANFYDNDGDEVSGITLGLNFRF